MGRGKGKWEDNGREIDRERERERRGNLRKKRELGERREG